MLNLAFTPLHAGAAMPMFSIFFGEFTNAFGNPSSSTAEFMRVVTNLSLKFLYLAIGEDACAVWGICGAAEEYEVSEDQICVWLRAYGVRQEHSYRVRKRPTGGQEVEL
jgi:hypothetical protein